MYWPQKVVSRLESPFWVLLYTIAECNILGTQFIIKTTTQNGLCRMMRLQEWLYYREKCGKVVTMSRSSRSLQLHDRHACKIAGRTRTLSRAYTSTNEVLQNYQYFMFAHTLVYITISSALETIEGSRICSTECFQN